MKGKNPQGTLINYKIDLKNRHGIRVREYVQ